MKLWLKESYLNFGKKPDFWKFEPNLHKKNTKPKVEKYLFDKFDKKKIPHVRLAKYYEKKIVTRSLFPKTDF